MRSPRGATLLVLLLLVGYAVLYGRAVLHDGGSPAFFVESHQGISVDLGDGFPAPGLHQYSDGTSAKGVIEMTGLMLAPGLEEDPRLLSPLFPGEHLDVLLNGCQVLNIQRKWMPASQRMALGIPLHPDRMNIDDWQALSGIGPATAERIEEDRQRNGDFGSLERLKRVRGIGPKSIEKWRKYFYDNVSG